MPRTKTISVGRSMSRGSVRGGHAIAGIGVRLERYKISRRHNLLSLLSKQAISGSLFAPAGNSDLNGQL